MAISNSGSAAGATPGTELLWAWNGVDLTQFRQGATVEVDSTGGAVLSVESGRYVQNVLRATAGGSGFSQWVIDTAEFPNGIPTRFVMDFMVEELSDGVGGFAPANTEVGVSQFCLYNSPGNVRAYTLGVGSGNSYSQVWCRDTTLAVAGTTPSGFGPGSSASRGARHIMVVQHDLSGTFDMILRGRAVGPTNAETLFNYNDVSSLDLDAGGFDSQTPNTFGIGARFFAADYYGDFSHIRILKHPADVVG